MNILVEEVTNCFVWRKQDATRNAIQLLGQAYFSQTELNRKNVKQIQDMLIEKYNVNFNNQRTDFKRGSCCKKINNNWLIDKEIPIFTKNRKYIENLI